MESERTSKSLDYLVPIVQGLSSSECNPASFKDAIRQRVLTPNPKMRPDPDAAPLQT